MKTLAQILKAGYKGNGLDNRDLTRLGKFIPAGKLDELGLTVAEGKTHTALPLTRESILAELRKDLDFAFEKALDKRGISAGLMYEVVKMWLWVLDDELAESEDYAYYGLPLFKQVAVKYGLDNPIGDDNGDEYRYDSD